MTKILVRGAAGFIGSATIAEFQKHSHDIYVINDLSLGNRDFLTIPDTYFHQLDILNGHGLNEVIHKIDPDWIIHLAAIYFIPYCNQHPFKSSNINIQGTINVLKAAKSLKNLEKMFFASAAAVYPICDDPIPETQQTNPLDIYGLSKLAGEHLMNELHLQTSISKVVIYPLLHGSGTKIKLQEAMNYGIPIVTTRCAGSGLSLNDGVNAFITDEPELYAQRALNLVKEPKVAPKISEEGAMTFEREYSRSAVYSKLDAMLGM